MADLVRAFLIGGALVASLRARFVLGVVVAIACALLFGVETYLPFGFPQRTDRIEVAFGAVFIGPSTMPHAPPFAASAILMDPSHHLATAILVGFAARSALRHGASLPELGTELRKYDRVSLRFIALGVILGLLSISGLVRHALVE